MEVEDGYFPVFVSLGSGVVVSRSLDENDHPDTLKDCVSIDVALPGSRVAPTLTRRTKLQVLDSEGFDPVALIVCGARYAWVKSGGIGCRSRNRRIEHWSSVPHIKVVSH